jgi:hypothetical protein
VKDTTGRLTHQVQACPDQTFAIVGYSQGAAVMHAAAAKFEPAVVSKIVAAVMFGDPSFRSAKGGNMFPGAIQGKLMENCNPGDPVSLLVSTSDNALLTFAVKVCDPSGGEFSGHLAYSKASYQKASADFIIAAFKGQPLPKAITSAADPNWPGNAKGRPAAKGQTQPKGQAPPKSNAPPMGQAPPPVVDQSPEPHLILTERDASF